MSLSPFDIVKNLFAKDKVLTDPELEGYSQWMINNVLSCDQQFVFLVNELNQLKITNRMHYDCLYNALPQYGKKYIPYLCKKESVEKEIQYLAEHFSVSNEIAKGYHKIIDPAEMKKIKNFFELRGIKK